MAALQPTRMLDQIEYISVTAITDMYSVKKTNPSVSVRHRFTPTPYSCSTNARCLSLRFCANGNVSSSPYGALYQLP